MSEDVASLLVKMFCGVETCWAAPGSVKCNVVLSLLKDLCLNRCKAISSKLNLLLCS